MLDEDGSGAVDFKEFVVAINVIMNGSDSEKLDWAFNLYDIDKNGTIADDEMVEIVKVSFVSIFLAFPPTFFSQLLLQTLTTSHAVERTLLLSN